VSGRLEQLARQIRRLRSTPNDPGRTLQRALHLGLDLSGEQTAGGDFTSLAGTGVITPALAERLEALVAKDRIAEHDVTLEAVVDLDVFLRSLENGAPALPLPLPPLGEPAKLPPGTQRSSVNLSGRVISVVGRDGRAFVMVDDKPIGQPFDCRSVPMGAPAITREPDGTVHLQWGDALHLVVGPDFSALRVSLV
jgi:hypothetical protein